MQFFIFFLFFFLGGGVGAAEGVNKVLYGSCASGE